MKVDALFQRWNKPEVPGCALGIERQGAPRLFRTYGSADLEHDVAIGPSTIFEAGSVSKQFTAASILILIEQGKLSFEDDIQKYIPELPNYGNKITIAHLLGHTSGLRDWEGVVEIAGWPRSTRTYKQKDALEVIARQKSLNFKPGTEYSYSNTGYILLAIIVERVSGESLAKFSSDHLFKPLGLTHTQWRDDFRRVVKGRAIAYEADPSGYHQNMPFDDIIGSGGLLTTVGDLLKWNDALDAEALGRFVTTELQRESTLSDGRAIPYARGLSVSSNHGARELWHDGQTAGYLSFLSRYPDQHASIALLCNAGEEVDPSSLGEKVADLLLHSQDVQPSAEQAPQSLTLSAEQLMRYAGSYFYRRTAYRINLEVKDGALRRAADGLVLTAIAPGSFKLANSIIRFDGNDGFVREFTDGRRAEYERIKPWHPGTDELSRLVGRYQSDEALATFQLSVLNGHLVIALDDRRWDTINLDPVSVDTFSTPHAVFHFIRKPNGGVSSLEVSNGLGVFALSFRFMGGAALAAP